MVFAIAGFYLYNLDGVGILLPDEPRYAAIGRSMAQTGDWITPRLWGTPWFEKPPLLYWMTATGTAMGLNPELSARLPTALLSLAFLGVSFILLRREFGVEAASVSVALLATSAGWMVFSSVALTDLPLAVFFGLAVWLALPLLRINSRQRHSAWRWAAIGVCLGLATLAKGLVPLALALPGICFLRKYWRNWWLIALACLIVAGPWYAEMYLRNGQPFVKEFFLKHHFERLYSASLQHVQPWYFYIPALLGGVFPWTPLLAQPGWLAGKWDERRRFLAATFLFGFVFFSASLNKLPGYVLPLIPVLFALIGAQFESRRLAEVSRWWLLPCALLIALIPLMAQGLPHALALGRISALRVGHISATEGFYIAAPLAAWVLTRRSWLGLLLVLCVVLGGIYLKATAYPVLDEQVSARSLWREMRDETGSVCQDWIGRDWWYGLNFYRGAEIPYCGAGRVDWKLKRNGHAKPLVEKQK